ncbi:MAG: ADP-glyceromanno-heptose 6-epimerase [Lentisphaerae bacterium GWF2_45_14]|nr:MAG: ADP-glyceromanno-heptose 6-epimerase [Lentisphaerae bacterium GWF2_45_14]
MYIVTGASGLIGSAVVWALNKRGIEDIIAVDHLGTSEKWKNLRALKFSDYHEKDAFRKLILENKFDPARIKAILHIGACSSTTEKDASYLADNNFAYTKELAEFADKNSIRFLYASSSATYGDGANGFVDDEESLEKLRPLNMYGYSKQIFDLWAKNKGLLKRIAGLKFTNVFGPGEYHKGDMRSVVIKSFEQVKDSGKIKLFKSYIPEYQNGNQMRDFLYVKDAVDMALFIMENKNINGIFNIGSGRAETWNSLANAVFSAVNQQPVIEYVAMPEHLKDKYQYYTKAEMGKLRSFGYAKECRSLQDSVGDYVKNYLIPNRYLGDSDSESK